MEESWAEIWVVLDLKFSTPEKAGTKVRLGDTQFLRFIYLHHAEKVDAVKCSKTFFRRNKNSGELEPSCFFSSKPALLKKKRRWLIPPDWLSTEKKSIPLAYWGQA